MLRSLLLSPLTYKHDFDHRFLINSVANFFLHLSNKNIQKVRTLLLSGDKLKDFWGLVFLGNIRLTRYFKIALIFSFETWNCFNFFVSSELKVLPHVLLCFFFFWRFLIWPFRRFLNEIDKFLFCQKTHFISLSPLSFSLLERESKLKPFQKPLGINFRCKGMKTYLYFEHDNLYA
jgi:hypothetical protein